jgi:hypothetical protein
MKKIPIFVITICLTLGTISLWLSVNPIVTKAATCTADCLGGSTVTCTGLGCASLPNNRGCVSIDAYGNQTPQYCPLIAD